MVKIERMVFIRMILVWNAIENWIRDRARSRLCNEPLNTHSK